MGKVVALMVALGALPQSSWSADDLITSDLVDQAREWQRKEREDLAANLRRKVFRAEPKHAEALVRLGFIKIRAGKLVPTKADASARVASEQKVRASAAIVLPKIHVSARPANKTEAETLNSKFSNSMGIAP